MKTEKWMPTAAFAALLTMTASCDDWGKQDPPAGNQVVPTLENVAAYDFEAEEGLDPSWQLIANPGGNAPRVIEDDTEGKGGKMLEINGGYASLPNPLNKVVCQEAVSLTFWLYQEAPAEEEGETPAEQDLSSPLISFVNETGNGRFYINANGGMVYDAADGEWTENDPATVKTGYLKPGEWHYVALMVDKDGYDYWVDGDRKVSKPVINFDCSRIVRLANNVKTMTIGAPETQSRWLVDDLKVYRNRITEKETKRPAIGGGDGPDVPSAGEVAPVYFLSFDAGMNGSSIQGGGEIKYVGGPFGNVFSNAMDGMRQNYLLLPSDVLSHSKETGALTMTVWVNRGNETDSGHYMWSPLFTAYSAPPGADNGMPMLACQYRGVLQINNSGWSDYTDVQNVNGVNGVYHNDTDWLADGGWHFYTVTFTATNAKVYFDGVIVNEWELDGDNNTAAGLFTNGADFKHICLGGNQAWNWGDPDPGFWFDDFAVYDRELSADQIKSIMSLKSDMIYGNTFSGDAGDATLMGAGKFIENTAPGFGKIFKNAVGGMRENYLLLPEGSLARLADTGEMTVSVWVNSTEAGDYYWNPLFTAYGEMPGGNGSPMFACQYRGVVSINTNGPDNQGGNWCDYTNDQSDTGEVILYHGDLDWLADKQWHLYTATFTPTRTIVYMDGNVANSWTLDGTSAGQVCDIKALATMKCICLGGNQAWNWGDPDPGFGFDDIFIYNKALTPEQIKQLMLLKNN